MGAKRKKETIPPKQRPYVCPEHLYQKMEAEALRRRKETGEIVWWSTILREILEDYYSDE